MKHISLLITALLLTACGADDDPVDENSNNQSMVLQALQVDEQEGSVTLQGYVDIQNTDYEAAELSVDLRWTLQDGTIKTTPTPKVSVVELVRDRVQFTMTGSATPPPEAFRSNEANEREGVAVSTLYLYIDGNGNDELDNTSRDIIVGASPNTLVLYGAEGAVKDRSKMFTYNGGPGATVKDGWFLGHATLNECEGRPTVRDWEPHDTIQSVVIGDFANRARCEVRGIWPDVD